jgi:hypothetical protein
VLSTTAHRRSWLRAWLCQPFLLIADPATMWECHWGLAAVVHGAACGGVETLQAAPSQNVGVLHCAPSHVAQLLHGAGSCIMRELHGAASQIIGMLHGASHAEV